jgi:hypothetical protein
VKAVGIAVFAILGAGLILTPLISDHLRQATATRLLESRPDLKEVHLGAGMSQEYRIVCWVAGGIMILIGAMFGTDPGQRSGKSFAALVALAVVIALSLAAGFFLWTS